MDESTNDTRVESAEKRRKFMLLAASAATVGGWACTTPIVPNRLPGTEIEPNTTVDEIHALGLPSAELFERLENRNLLALIGRARTYLVVRGVGSITDLALRSGNSFGFLPDSKKLFLLGNVFWGHLSLYSNRGDSRETMLLQVSGVTVPALNLSEVLGRKTKLMSLVLRDAPLLMSQPDLSTFITYVPHVIRVDSSRKDLPSDLGGFPVYSFSDAS